MFFNQVMADQSTSCQSKEKLLTSVSWFKVWRIFILTSDQELQQSLKRHFVIYCCSPEEKEKPNQKKTHNLPHSEQVRASHPLNWSSSHKFWCSQVWKILYHAYYVNTLSWDMLQIWAEVTSNHQTLSWWAFSLTRTKTFYKTSVKPL